MWLLVSGEMNFAGRFQYPILILAALSWYPLVRGAAGDLGLGPISGLAARQRMALLVASAMVLGLVLRGRIVASGGLTYPPDGRREVAIALRGYADRGYTMAVTEAGLLPYYSRWRAIDAWGLNDPWIAHQGGISTDYLERARPELVVWHGFFSPMVPAGEPAGDPWAEMVDVLREYVRAHDYLLAAAFGRSPFDTHYYWVRRDLPEAAEIVDRIRATPYPWYAGGGLALDFASSVEPGADQALSAQAGKSEPRDEIEGGGNPESASEADRQRQHH